MTSTRNALLRKATITDSTIMHLRVCFEMHLRQFLSWHRIPVVMGTGSLHNIFLDNIVDIPRYSHIDVIAFCSLQSIILPHCWATVSRGVLASQMSQLVRLHISSLFCHTMVASSVFKFHTARTPYYEVNVSSSEGRMSAPF